MALSIIATLISSVALAGVAIGLILQARQLRTSQIQASRSLHAEIIKMVMDNPSLEGATMSGSIDPADIPKALYLNFLISFLQTSYSLKSIPRAAVSIQAQRIFASEYSRSWWSTLSRDIYRAEAMTKRDRDFVATVDYEYKKALQKASEEAPHGKLASELPSPDL